MGWLMVYLLVGLVIDYFIWYTDIMKDELSVMFLVMAPTVWPVITCILIAEWLANIDLPRRKR